MNLKKFKTSNELAMEQDDPLDKQFSSVAVSTFIAYMASPLLGIHLPENVREIFLQIDSELEDYLDSVVPDFPEPVKDEIRTLGEILERACTQALAKVPDPPDGSAH